MTEPDEALRWARESAYQRALEMFDGDETEALAQIDHEDAEYVINWLAEADRAGAAASAERIKALEAALREVADDLEAEIKARAGGDLPRRVERDLEPVFRARALLKEPDQ